MKWIKYIRNNGSKFELICISLIGCGSLFLYAALFSEYPSKISLQETSGTLKGVEKYNAGSHRNSSYELRFRLNEHDVFFIYKPFHSVDLRNIEYAFQARKNTNLRILYDKKLNIHEIYSNGKYIRSYDERRKMHIKSKYFLFFMSIFMFLGGTILLLLKYRNSKNLSYY
ncbi:MAG: hypothetical protein ACRBCI_12110 [Cellvibrionaceae bacterium]